MFIAALFIIAKTWEQPKCLIYRGMDKEDVVHIYNGILLNHKKVNEMMPFAATCMDVEIITLSKKDKYISLIYVI